LRARVVALAGALALIACLPAAAGADSWTRTGSMLTRHDSHTATLLPSGKVLVLGGHNGSVRTTASELYDPTTGVWSATGSSTITHTHAAASLLPDGKVLVAGGGLETNATTSAELFDPASTSWSPTGSMAAPREDYELVTLDDGTALAIGGYDGRSVATVERYFPSAGLWVTAAPLSVPRESAAAVVLRDGSVLVTGGYDHGVGAARLSTERYDPAANRWTSTATMSGLRAYHTATLLADGRVLVAGGDMGNALTLVQSSAELYDPATDRWSSAGNMTTPRAYAQAALLPNGKVLVAGGYYGARALASADLYDPATNRWSSAGAMSSPRWVFTLTPLPDGRVLAAGGDSGGGTVASADLYTPDGWPFTSGRGSPGDRGGGGTGGGGGSGSGSPRISSIALSATRFRAAGSGPSVTAARRRRAPVGTTISYRDGAAATSTFAVQRPAAGRRSSGRCVKPTHANRRKAHCTRWVTVGRFRHADTAGPNTLRFSGRVNGHKLSPGRYHLTITARIGRGRPSAAKTIAFQIVR
jgi:hypothetical protein